MTESPLLRWFRSRRPAGGERRLEAALINRRVLSYCLWRLRFVALNGVIAMLVPVLEYTALRKAFGVLHVMELFSMHVAGVALLGAVWGGLHGYRARVRDAWLSKGRTAALHLASLTVSRVAIVSTVLAYVTLIVFALVAQRAPALTERGAYLAACVLRLAVGATLQAVHSTVFSVMRVRRPLWAFRIGDLLGLGTLLAFPGGGPWVQVARVLGVTAVSAVVAAFFLRRSWRQLGLGRLRLHLRVWGRWSPEWRSTTADVVAGAGLRALHLLVIGALLGIWGNGREARGSVLVFFAAPALGLAAAWPAAFYFDLSRTARSPLEAHGHRELVGCLRIMAPLLGLLCGGTGALLLGGANLAGWGFPLGYLLPLGAGLAALSTELTLALCERQWLAAVLRLAPLVALPFAAPAFRALNLDLPDAQNALPLTVASLAMLGVPVTAARSVLPGQQPLAAGAWRALAMAMPTCELGFVHIPLRGDSSARTRAYALAAQLAADGWATTTDGERVLMLRPSGTPIRASSLAVKCAGLATRTKIATVATANLAALLGDWLRFSRNGDPSERLAEAAFGGLTVRLGAKGGPRLRAGAARSYYRQALSDALGRSAPAHQGAFGYAPAGSLEQIIVVEPPLPRRGAQRLRGALWSAQILGLAPGIEASPSETRVERPRGS